MRREPFAAVRTDALTREVQSRPRTLGIRCEIEWKKPAGDGLLVEPELRMDPTESILLEEQTSTIFALPQISLASKDDRDGFTQLRLPTLRFQTFDVMVAKLHAEVPAAVAASVAGVPLILEFQDVQRDANRHGPV